MTWLASGLTQKGWRRGRLGLPYTACKVRKRVHVRVFDLTTPPRHDVERVANCAQTVG